MSNPTLSITLRTALLSWLVTIVTLLIFVAVIIPQQKRTFVENLESKAQGVAVSLHEVAAGAAVNDDSSSVVDRCVEMLRGDPSLDFLVITKNSGASLVITKNNGSEAGAATNNGSRLGKDRLQWGWETNSAKGWQPARREAVSGIGIVPFFARRVFHYSHPFDYSGIRWGWIHVGLSLESYDRSVAMVYNRTGVLAIVCILLSLAASGVYARQLVQPILHLRRVVQKVAGGDLSARAVVERGDELGNLAGSVNSMTEALLRRDQILQSVRFAAQQFLSSSKWDQVIEGVLAKIGKAAAVGRIQVFQSIVDERGNRLLEQRHVWAAAGCEPDEGGGNEKRRSLPALGLGGSEPLLERGEMVMRNTAELDEQERSSLASCGIKSVIAVPISVEGSWWGLLSLVDCAREREWTDAERDSLRAAADMLGAAINRHRIQEALMEAKATLEQRVEERTRELRDQMLAKEKAHAELADVQLRLIEASRMAGMAEVATGVLHNVGNVLNSVGVSSTLVIERLRHSRVSTLRRATDLLREKNGSLGEFLTADPKGKLLPEYLGAVADKLVDEQAFMLEEMVSVGQHIEHIKQIVAMQQSFAKVSGTLENLSAVGLVEDALRINTAMFERHRIRVVRELDEQTPAVSVDRHKVLQILVNLLRNAKDAMNRQNAPEKELVLRVEKAPPDRVRIIVRDHGIGIAPENLIRIFSHGFTTKKDGHGFGLHSGANAAKEMGGSLTAYSGGIGQGATFTLELPATSCALEKGSQCYERQRA